MSRTVTLIVHGTFAAAAKWWRLGSEGEATFADRLESELSRRGLEGTVWKPALAHGFTYSSFAWSGRNRHSDRVKGAERLSSSLNELGKRVAATPTEPLMVNFVAHSHGGNVVLEAVRYLNSCVRVSRIALLGTPLVSVRPAFRIARFVFSAFLLGIFFLLLLYLIMQVVTFFFTCVFASTCHVISAEAEYGPHGEVTSKAMGGGLLLLLVVPTLILYGWLFSLFGTVLDQTWRIFCWLAYPIDRLRKKARSLVYGPSPDRLAEILGGTPILLLTAYNDEADLLLQIGSAPVRLYREYVATNFSRLGRLLESALLRPFVLNALLEPVEMLLEVFSLGVPLWRALFLDFEVAPLDKRPYYPSRLLVRQTLDVRPRPGAWTDVAVGRTNSSAGQSGFAPRRGLRLSLQEVAEEITRQIQLRHSAYYESSAVVDRVAKFLIGGDSNPAGS
jgi:hypothetical protein